ncbi:MAG: cytochrome b/b6 domain-containing protein [Ignavibacteriae bacterium]|nr:cytochrome b/b6 domain-containing protein [Ignavibacteriota bacterium]
MKKIYLYPFWLRFWHWFNALLFFVLIVSGLSLHYADPKSFFIPFGLSIITHNVAGILLTLNYLLFFILNFAGGNYKFYLPEIKGFWSRVLTQTKYYIIGILIGESHPFSVNEKRKFNPMQQIAYIVIMYLFMPLIVVTGWLLMFPELAPNEFFGMGGVWPMALAHAVTGFVLRLFIFAHIYLGTTGNTIGELFKSMITGWHLVHPEDQKPEIEPGIKPGIDKSKLFPIIFYNPVTLTGSLLSVLSSVIILFFIVVEFFSEFQNPYLGIITYVVLPTFLIIGLLLIALGAIRENRRILSLELKQRKLPVIDLNNPKHQVAVFVFSAGTILLTVFSIYGAFKAYEYTDSDDFCGKVCHTVMQPEYTAYQDSPHSRVGCVKCHIGPGAGWFVRSKLSGSYQVYSVLFKKYSKPWVKVKSRTTGKETIYRDTSFKVTGNQLKAENLRVMDCIDCHNRPSHVFYQPNRMINAYLSNNQIDRTIPYLKNVGVQVLETYTRSRETAKEDISKFIWNFYNSNYPDVAVAKKQQLKKLVDYLHKIYMRNYFPNMKSSWKSNPNNIGHMYSPGCFRCHDGKHVSDDGKVITNDCNACHVIATQQPPGQPMQESATGLKFFHPGGEEKLISEQLCSNCHGVRKKSQVFQVSNMSK